MKYFLNSKGISFSISAEALTAINIKSLQGKLVDTLEELNKAHCEHWKVTNNEYEPYMIIIPEGDLMFVNPENLEVSFSILQYISELPAEEQWTVEKFISEMLE